MTDRTAPSSLRRRLAVSSALAGGVLAGGLLLAPPARADFALPTGGSVLQPGGGATIQPIAITALDTLNVTVGNAAGKAAIINWNTFSIGSQNTVNFTRGAGVTGTATVVNRVVGLPSLLPGAARGYLPSVINGTLTGANVNVWLLNPAGILIGSTGAITTSGFVGSTLDICASDLCNAAGDGAAVSGLLNGLGGAGGSPVALRARMVLAGGATAAIRNGGVIDTTGTRSVAPGAAGPIVLLSGMIASTGTVNAGTAVTFVAADAVTLADPGSPMAVSIDAGTTIGGTLIETGGSVAGRSVLMAAASRDTVMNALLNIGGTISATGATGGAGGITLSAGVGDAGGNPAGAGAAAFTDAARNGRVVIGGGAAMTTDGALAIAGNRGIAAGGSLSGKTVAFDAGGDLRVASATATDGALSVVSRGGDISGIALAATATGIAGFARANLTARDGDVTATALSANPERGQVRLGTVAARTSETSGAAPLRGNVAVTGRIVDVTTADAAGALTLTARDAAATPAAGANDVRLLVGTTLAGTTATLVAGQGLAAAPVAGSGGIVATSVAAGRDRRFGPVTAIAGDARLTAAGDVAVDTVSSGTGGVFVTAADGDVTGRAGGRAALAAAVRADAVGGALAVADAPVAVTAGGGFAAGGGWVGTARAGKGLALIGPVSAGAAVAIDARAIDAGDIATQAGGIGLTAHDGYVSLASADAGQRAGVVDGAGFDINLRAVGGPDVAGSLATGALAAGDVRATGPLIASRDVRVSADNIATIAGAVTAGRIADDGVYGVAGVRGVVLGSGTAVVQQAAGGVRIEAAGTGATTADITAQERLVLQSNSRGLADPASADPGTRSLSLAASGALRLGPPPVASGLEAVPPGVDAATVAAATVATLAALDARAPMLIGGTAGARSDVVVAAGGGTIALGTVQARQLRGPRGDAVTNALTATDFAAHRIEVTDDLTIHAANITLDTASAGLLDTAVAGRSITLETAGFIRGTTLAEPSATRTGYHVGTALAATGAVTATAGEARFGMVRAGGMATLATGGTLRVADLVAARVSLDAVGNLRVGAALATAGDLGAVSQGGDVTGFALPDDAGVTGGIAGYGRATLGASDGNVTVTAASTDPLRGQARLGAVTAWTSETGGSAPVRGNLSITGRVVDVDAADAAGALVLAARDASTAGVNDVRLVVGTALAGTTATLVAGQGGAMMPVAGSGGITATTVSAGRDRRFGGGTALAGDARLTAATDIAVDTVSSGTGGVFVTAIDGDITGRTTAGAGAGTGAGLAAAVATVATGGDLAVADGGIDVRALAATTGRGTVRIGTATAGGDVAVQARAIEASAITATRGALALTATALPGGVSGIALGSGTAGTTAALMAAGRGDVIASVLAGTNRAVAGGAAMLTAERGDIRVGTVTSGTGDVAIRALDGNVTTRDAAPSMMVAASRAVASGNDAAIADGRVTVEALSPATGRGLVQLGTVAAGADVTIRARRIEAAAATATRGALALTATPLAGGPAGITLGNGAAGATATLVADGRGDIDITALRAGTNRTTANDAATVTAAGGAIRLGDVASDTGNVIVTATDGDVTATTLAAASRGAGGAGVADGSVIVRALATTAGRGTATIGTAIAGSDVTIDARRIDAGTLAATHGALALTATALPGSPAGIALGSGTAGRAATLATTGPGGIVATSLTAGTDHTAEGSVATLRSATGDIRVGGITSLTGDVALTADDGDISATLLSAATRASAMAGGAAGGAAVDDGSVIVRALATTAGRGTATIGTAIAGSDVTIDARRIEAGTLAATRGALVLTATALPGGPAGIALGDGSAGTAATLTAAGRGDVIATRLTAGTDRTVAGSVATLMAESGDIRIDTVTSVTGDVLVRALDGDVTGAAGGISRASLAAAQGVAGGADGPPVADGRVMVEALAATAGRGVARLGVVTAGDAVAVRARAIDATTVAASRGAVALEAVALPGGVSGIVVGTVAAGTTATLAATGRGDLVAGQVAAGGNRAIVGSAATMIASAGDIRVGTLGSATGDVTIRAIDGDVTAAMLSAATRVAVAGGAPGVTDGTITVEALATASGRGTVTIGEALAGAGVMVRARRIKATTVTAMHGALALTATPLAAGPAGIALGSGTAGASASLVVEGRGAIDATALRAGTNRTAVGDAATVTAAEGVIRLGSIASDTGDVVITATDGDVTATTLAGASRAPDGAGMADGSVIVRALATTAGRGTVVIGTATAGNVVTIDARRIEAGTLAATNGALALTATPLAAGPAGIALGSGTAGATATLVATRGDIDASMLRAGTRSAPSGAVATVTASAGSVRLGSVSSDIGDVVVTATDGDVTATTLAAATRGPGVADGSVTVRALATTAGRGTVAIGTATAGGNVTIDARRIEAGTLVADRGALALTSIALADGPAGIVLGNGTAGASATLVTGGAGDIRATVLTAGLDPAGGRGEVLISSAGSALLGAVASRTGSIAVETRGGIVIGAGGVTGGAVADGNGTITLTTGAGIEIAAPLRASRVLVNNRSAGGTRLGGAAVDAEATIGSSPFALSTAEFGQIDTPGLTIDSTGRNVAIDTLALTAAAGREAVRIYTDAAMTVNGRVSFAGTSPARTIQLGGGGEAAATARATSLTISSQGQNGTGTRTGQVDAGAATLDLRANRIVAGRDDFIAAVARSGDVAGDFVAQPQSLLYESRLGGGTGYDPGAVLVSAGRLVVRYGDYALFQNTAQAGSSGGVLVTGPAGAGPPLRLVAGGATGGATGANALALFGSVEQGDNPSRLDGFVPRSSTALLGQIFVGTIGADGTLELNPNNARINGCLIGSTGGGCLVTALPQPSFNTLDVSRQQVISSSDDLDVTFDPAVGSNNDALFGDAAAGDYQFDAKPCPDGTTAVQCRDGGTN